MSCVLLRFVWLLLPRMTAGAHACWFICLLLSITAGACIAGRCDCWRHAPPPTFVQGLALLGTQDVVVAFCRRGRRLLAAGSLNLLAATLLPVSVWGDVFD